MNFHTLVASLVLSCTAWLPAAETRLEETFQNLPNADKPWVYWWWLNGNVDERSITRDLEAMKQQGIGGLLMFDSRAYHDDKNHVIIPPSKFDFMSPEWRRMLKHAMHEAQRLGLEMSVNLSSCAGALKGPWEVGDDAPKKLVWTSAELNGPQKLTCELQKPKGRRLWDVALLAVQHDEPADPSLDVSAILSANFQDVATKLGTKPMATKVVNLTANLDEQGRLTWDVPPGHWTVLRFAGLRMSGHDFDVDVLDPKAVTGHFERMGKTLLDDAGPLAGANKTLTHFYSVSWEGATPTWTLALEQEFKKYRDYELRPWLPVLAGFRMIDQEQSERFLRDYYKTLGDCFLHNFYGTLQKLCENANMKWHSESGGPWNRRLPSFSETDQLAFLSINDMPQGEFWFTNDPARQRLDMNRPQAMTANTYGKRLAATEAFTHMVQHWSEYPAALKPFADTAFIDGANHFIWHTFTCSPPEFGLPGSEYFAGSHLNPNVTWFPLARPFIDYLARCQHLLRQGKAVNDVCTYIGDKPYQHWGRGANWSDRATLRLPKGYNYDIITTEVLLDRLTMKEGDLVLPDGMSYRVLVVDLDDETVPPAALKKIAQLKQAGATILFGKRKPLRAPGLTNFPRGDEEVRQLAAALWENPAPLDITLKAKRMLPDFNSPCEYTHRRTNDTDIYFVTGQGPVQCTFRVSGKQPELWDAVSGKITASADWKATTDGRTTVSLTLPQNGSTFVVFRKPAQPPEARPTPASPPEEMTLNGAWNVSFEGGRGAPESAVFEQLTAWNEHPNDGIKHFSGKASYRMKFDLTADQAKRTVRLRLGEVKHIAQVRLNGQDMGIIWTDPWSIALTSAIKAGGNELEISVVNTWVNRLIGDAALPMEKRITKTNVALQPGKRKIQAYQGFGSEDPLMRSGLLGPVRLEFLP